MDQLVEVIVNAAIALSVYACFYRWILHTSRAGPRVWPIVGCWLEMRANQGHLLDWLTTYLQQSPTISVPIFHLATKITIHPANAEYVLKTNFDNYPKGDTQHAMFRELLGDGIFNIDGAAWKSQRKAASYEFASKVLHNYSTDVFRDGALNLAGILARAAHNCHQVDMQDLFMRMTLDSICKVGFGTQIGSLHHTMPTLNFAESFNAATFTTARRFSDPLWRVKRYFGLGSEASFIKHTKVLEEFAHKVIKDRVAELGAPNQPADEPQFCTPKVDSKQARSDLLSRFILLAKDKGSQGSTNFLRDAMLNFTIAGRDTSAVSLSWFLYLVSTHPDVEDKIVAELLKLETQGSHAHRPVPLSTESDVAADDHEARLHGQFANRAVTYEALGRMTYLHAAVTESLRLYPPVPLVAKVCQSDDRLPDGTRVQKGDLVVVAPYCMARMERLWGPDASEFRPERWLKDGAFQPVSPFKFVTFNAGPRTCLGKDSAYLQLKMTAAILLRFFKFQVVPEHKVECRARLVMPMHYGLKMTVHGRS